MNTYAESSRNIIDLNSTTVIDESPPNYNLIADKLNAGGKQTNGVSPCIIDLNNSAIESGNLVTVEGRECLSMCEKTEVKVQNLLNLDGVENQSKTKSNPFSIAKKTSITQSLHLFSSIDDSYEDLNAIKPMWIESDLNLDIEKDVDSDIENMNIPALATIEVMEKQMETVTNSIKKPQIRRRLSLIVNPEPVETIADQNQSEIMQLASSLTNRLNQCFDESKKVAILQHLRYIDDILTNTVRNCDEQSILTKIRQKNIGVNEQSPPKIVIDSPKQPPMEHWTPPRKHSMTSLPKSNSISGFRTPNRITKDSRSSPYSLRKIDHHMATETLDMSDFVEIKQINLQKFPKLKSMTSKNLTSLPERFRPKISQSISRSAPLKAVIPIVAINQVKIPKPHRNSPCQKTKKDRAATEVLCRKNLSSLRLSTTPVVPNYRKSCVSVTPNPKSVNALNLGSSFPNRRRTLSEWNGLRSDEIDKLASSRLQTPSKILKFPSSYKAK